jgi:hypothetical membrane protein
MSQNVELMIKQLREPGKAPATRTTSLLWALLDALIVGLAAAGIWHEGHQWWVWVVVFLVAFPAAVGNASNFTHYKRIRAEYDAREARRLALLEEALRNEL